MKFKLVENYSYEELLEGGLSRIWQHTKDDKTFAIIGSQDKDTKEDRSDELTRLVSKYASQHRGEVGYKYLFGRYEYEDGTIGEEKSVIIFNIPKEKALEFASKNKGVNQESIIWKDDNFFGFLTQDGREDGKFTSNTKNMNLSDEDIKLFGSRLAKHKNKNQTQWYKFVMEQFVPDEKSSIRNMATSAKKEKEPIFSIVIE